VYSPEQIQQRLTKQFFEDENGNIVIGTTTYTVNDLLTDETIRNKARQYIMDNFHYNIDEDGLNKNYLGGDLQS
jgi:phage terminase large subunit